MLAEEGLDVGLLMQGSRDLNASVVVAALPSLATTLLPLLEASTIPIRTILIDEAHHAVPGSSYEDVLLVIEAQDETESVVTVGFTATPYRSDSQSMLTLLPTCAFARDIPEMVQAGRLAPLTWVPMTFDVNLSAVPITTNVGEESDYSQEELTLMNDNRSSRYRQLELPMRKENGMGIQSRKSEQLTLRQDMQRTLSP